MFGIGWSELAVIFCIAIIFIHPRDLPRLFRKLGKLYAEVKKAYAEITATKDQLVKDIEAAASDSSSDDGEADTSMSSSGSGAPAEKAPEGVGGAHGAGGTGAPNTAAADPVSETAATKNSVAEQNEQR